MTPSVSGCIKLHSLLKDLCGNGMINPSGDVAMQGVCMAGGIKLQGCCRDHPSTVHLKVWQLWLMDVAGLNRLVVCELRH